MKVLIVDDDRMSFLIAESIFKNMGFSSFGVKNCNEALSYIDENKIDLILMDLGLPDLDGFKTSKKIKSVCDVSCMIPIIAISGTITEDTIDKVKEIGLLGPLVKPIDPQLLQTILHEIKSLTQSEG